MAHFEMSDSAGVGERYDYSDEFMNQLASFKVVEFEQPKCPNCERKYNELAALNEELKKEKALRVAFEDENNKLKARLKAMEAEIESLKKESESLRRTPPPPPPPSSPPSLLRKTSSHESAGLTRDNSEDSINYKQFIDNLKREINNSTKEKLEEILIKLEEFIKKLTGYIEKNKSESSLDLEDYTTKRQRLQRTPVRFKRKFDSTSPSEELASSLDKLADMDEETLKNNGYEINYELREELKKLKANLEKRVNTNSDAATVMDLGATAFGGSRSNRKSKSTNHKTKRNRN